MARSQGATMALVAGTLEAGSIVLAAIVIGLEAFDFLDVLTPINLVVQAFVLATILMLPLAPQWARVIGVVGVSLTIVADLFQFIAPGPELVLWVFWLAHALVCIWVVLSAMDQVGALRILGFAAAVLSVVVSPVNYLLLGQVPFLWVAGTLPLAAWLIVTGLGERRRAAGSPTLL